jgi:hypothetical protein
METLYVNCYNTGIKSTITPLPERHSECPLDPSLLNGKSVHFHVFDLDSTVGADARIVDPTAPFYDILNEAQLLNQYEAIKNEKGILNRATLTPPEMMACVVEDICRIIAAFVYLVGASVSGAPAAAICRYVQSLRIGPV